MNPCNCAGINVTWSCNASCKHCFYRRNPNLHKNIHKPLQEIIKEMREGLSRGINRIVLIGEGEPMLHPKIKEIIIAAGTCGLKSNIITNGTIPIKNYEELFKLGLNHIQISAHAIGEALDEIMEYKEAGKRQGELMTWLKENKLPFRANISLQQLNYKQLPETTQYLIDKGAFHIALLGFLPHYEWKDHVAEIAVHPEELRPYIEKAAELLISSGAYFTIRYHPICHLSPKYWKHVVNARYVLYDPWEWDYGRYQPNPEAVWPAALAMGESTAIQGQPCEDCTMKLHCGGWNRYYVAAFQGAALKTIQEIPFEGPGFKHPGTFHDMNPANSLKGYCVNGRPV
jgi:MoaA/NifB/PqqE/SkfB family radical SAM enzyme